LHRLIDVPLNGLSDGGRNLHGIWWGRGGEGPSKKAGEAVTDDVRDREPVLLGMLTHGVVEIQGNPCDQGRLLVDRSFVLSDAVDVHSIFQGGGFV
jgi:hypothetical protein